MTENPSPESSKSPPRRRGRRVLKIALVVVGILVVLVAALPLILSLGIARSQAASIASRQLGTDVQFDGVDVGWTGNVDVAGMVIAQPAGFDHPEPLLRLDALAADVALASLLGGRVGLTMRASGAHLVVIQKPDGTTNVQALGAEKEPPPTEQPSEGQQEPDEEPAADDGLQDVRLDVRLSDTTVTILHTEQGVLETLTGVTASVSKPFGSDALKLTFDAGLAHGETAGESGKIAIEADLRTDPDAPIEVRVDATDVELARLEPLVVSFLEEGALERFSGRLRADLRMSGVPSGEMTTSGTLEVEQPDIVGTLTRGLRLKAPRWTVRTDASATLPGEAGALRADLSGLAVDLGFLTLQGVAAAEGRAGFDFGVDVASLATEGSPIPALLAGTGTRLDGRIELPLDLGLAAKPIGELLAALTLDATLKVDRLEYASQALTGLGLDLDLSGGRARVATTAGQLAGGNLRLTVEADAADLQGGRVSFDVGIDGAQLQGSAATALRYAVPLFAGLGTDATPARFEALGDLRLAANGPLMPGEGQSILAWLGGFGGDGSVALRDGGFVPVGELARLGSFVTRLAPQASMAAAGGGAAESGGARLLFERIGTSFSVDGGVIRSDTTDLLPGGEEIQLVGTTSLAGQLEHTLDLRGLFRGHQDGEKVLKYLGDEPLGATLTGTLTDPSLALPKLEDLLRRAMRNALETEGRDALKDLLEGITGKQDGAADPLHDAIEQGVGEVLKGVLGGSEGKEGGAAEDPLRKGVEDVLKGVLGGSAPKEGDKEGAGSPEDALKKTAEDLLKGVLGGDRKKEGSGDGDPKQSPPPNPLQRLLRGVVPPPKREGGGGNGGNGGGGDRDEVDSDGGSRADGGARR